MPDCGVHYLWFAFVCFLIRSPPPPPSLSLSLSVCVCVCVCVTCAACIFHLLQASPSPICTVNVRLGDNNRNVRLHIQTPGVPESPDTTDDVASEDPEAQATDAIQWNISVGDGNEHISLNIGSTGEPRSEGPVLYGDSRYTFAVQNRGTNERQQTFHLHPRPLPTFTLPQDYAQPGGTSPRATAQVCQTRVLTSKSPHPPTFTDHLPPPTTAPFGPIVGGRVGVELVWTAPRE